MYSEVHTSARIHKIPIALIDSEPDEDPNEGRRRSLMKSWHRAKLTP